MLRILTVSVLCWMVCDHGKDILGCFVVCLLDPRSAPYTYIVSSDIPYLGLLKAPLFCFFLWGKGVLSSWSVNLSKSFCLRWRLEAGRWRPVLPRLHIYRFFSWYFSFALLFKADDRKAVLALMTQQLPVSFSAVGLVFEDLSEHSDS